MTFAFGRMRDFFKRNDPTSRAIDRAIEHLEAGEHDAAAEVLRVALAREPGHRRALLHLGVAHMLKGEFDLAEEILLPISRRDRIDSESAAARVALDKIAADRDKAK